MIGASVLQSMVIQIDYNNGNCNAILCSLPSLGQNHHANNII